VVAGGGGGGCGGTVGGAVAGGAVGGAGVGTDPSGGVVAGIVTTVGLSITADSPPSVDGTSAPAEGALVVAPHAEITNAARPSAAPPERNLLLAERDWPPFGFVSAHTDGGMVCADTNRRAPGAEWMDAVGKFFVEVMTPICGNQVEISTAPPGVF